MCSSQNANHFMQMENNFFNGFDEKETCVVWYKCYREIVVLKQWEIMYWWERAVLREVLCVCVARWMAFFTYGSMWWYVLCTVNLGHGAKIEYASKLYYKRLQHEAYAWRTSSLFVGVFYFGKIWLLVYLKPFQELVYISAFISN